jgi:hypothetical protein
MVQKDAHASTRAAAHDNLNMLTHADDRCHGGSSVSEGGMSELCLQKSVGSETKKNYQFS